MDRGISMLKEETAEPVVEYLRGLTSDGELSSQEVMQLANWLNKQSKETLENWPAKPLVNALQGVLADNQLTAQEMEELADTIVAIEELWVESHPQAGVTHEAATHEGTESAETEETKETDDKKPTVPSIPLTVTVMDAGRVDEFTVDLHHHVCTCPDWIDNRGVFREGDYRRCCVHLLHAFRAIVPTNEVVKSDPLFVAFVEAYSAQLEAPALDYVWHIVDVDGVRVLYGSAPTSEWVTVFAPADGAYRRFGYNRKNQSWEDGDRPDDVSWQIGSIFSQTRPHAVSSAD